MVSMVFVAIATIQFSASFSLGYCKGVTTSSIAPSDLFSKLSPKGFP
jgi:hypothetical protein